MDPITIIIILVISVSVYLTTILVAEPLHDKVPEPFNLIIYLVILIAVAAFAAGFIVPIVLNVLGLP